MTGHPDEESSADRKATFGERLRELRMRAGLSQSELGGDELHPSYVSLLESGKRRPTPAAVSVLAARLGVPEADLLQPGPVIQADAVVLAQAALGAGRPGDALAILDRPLSEGASFDLEGEEGFRAAMTYATSLERVGRLEDATAQYEALRAAAEASPGRHPWLPVAMALVRCYRDAGDLSRAVDLGESAIKRCEDLGRRGVDGYAGMVSTLAGVYSERGDYLRAKVLLDELRDEVDRGISPTDRAYAYWESAINAADRGQAGEGARLAERASALLSESDDERSRARIQVTRAWLMLAQDPPQAAEARRILRQALPTLRSEAGQLSVASAETELARAELLLGRSGVAARLARSALKRLQAEHRIERARALVALGAALVDSGETAAGLAELAGAATALEGVGADRQAAPVWRLLGTLYREAGDLSRAIHAADRALDAIGVAKEQILSLPNHPSTGRRQSLPPNPAAALDSGTKRRSADSSPHAAR